MPADETEEDEWKFSVDEFDDPSGADAATSSDSSAPFDSSNRANTRSESGAVDADRSTDDDEEGSNDDANVAGEFAPQVPVVPEMPNLEDAAFVTLGAILMALLIGSLVGRATFDLFDALTVAVVIAALGALTYGAFVRLTPDT